MNKEIEIPKGYEAKIEGNKVILELKESEDERIRKTLLRCCDDWEKGQFGCMAKEDVPAIRAYLEKQKEQKHAEQLDGTFTSYDMAKTFMEGQNYVLAHPEKFGLCKSAEWSEEDKQTIRDAINRIGQLDHYWNKPTDEKLIERLKSLRPQPHWNPSAQEKVALRTAIHILTEERNFPKAAAHLQNILNVFEGKSRRDWKPSEEQMKSLKSCVYGGLFKMEVLQELYNDLLEKL